MYKKTIIIIASLFMFLFCQFQAGADILQESRRRAEQEDKTIILFFYSKYCSYCDAMEKNVLQDKEIKSLLKSEMIFLPVDVDKNKEMTRAYGVRAYPTTLLLEKTGKRIVQIPGYLERAEFRTLLTYASTKAYKRMNLVDYLRHSGKK